MQQAPRQWASLQYYDPKVVLQEWRTVQLQVAGTDTDPKVASLRTRGLRGFLEGRQAALFAYLIGQWISRDVSFAPIEQSDYDAVLSWVGDDERNFAPVQLKELVPDKLNASANLKTLLAGLAKYVDSRDLVVAIHLNRRGSLDLDKLKPVELPVREVWLYGAASPDQSKWFICGNICNASPAIQIFDYPGT